MATKRSRSSSTTSATPKLKRPKSSTVTKEGKIARTKGFDALKHLYTDAFNTTLDNLKSTLDTYGVAVLPGVLDTKECAEMTKGMWDAMTHMTSEWELPITQDNPKSWTQYYKKMAPANSMIQQKFGMGQAPILWKLRCNPRVIGAFAKIWGTEDLITSFDAAAYHIQTAPQGKPPTLGVFRAASMHVDQCYRRNGFECIQSSLTAGPVNVGDATFACLPGSHKLHAEFAEKFPNARKSTKDWYRLKGAGEYEFYTEEKGLKEVRITCPSGSMIFFDSRLVHAGVAALHGRPSVATVDGLDVFNTRLTAYICMVPSKLLTAAERKKKLAALEHGETTSHWPHRITCFEKRPWNHGKELPLTTAFPAPKLSEIGRRLAGY